MKKYGELCRDKQSFVSATMYLRFLQSTTDVFSMKKYGELCRDKQCRSVRGAGRRTQPTSKLLNDLLITSALNPTCLLPSALNPTCLLQVSDFPTHLYLRSGSLIIGKISA